LFSHGERSDLSAEAQRAKAEAIYASAGGEMDCFVAMLLAMTVGNGVFDKTPSFRDGA
jgi:hypothetical protein